LGALKDNSFLTHLATGRLIADTGHIPRSDPYSFTAAGADWVVQSWFASLLYAWVEDLAGGMGLRLLMGASTAGITLLAWRLARPAQGLLVRFAIGGLVVGVGADQWSERPLLVGLLALATTVLAAEGGVDPRWLLPLAWIWTNSHGSFPLGLVYLVVVAVGRRLDGERPDLELRCLRWLGLGTLLAVLNPLGPKILLFPAQLLANQDALSHVVEWQSPAFRSLGERLFLLQVLLALLALVRRPSYRDGLVVAVFLSAALLGSRNIAIASLLLVPILARAWPDVGGLRSDARDGLARPFAAVGVAAVLLVPIARLDRPHFDLRPYPTESLDYIDDQEIDLTTVRMATQERVGNLLELRDGAVGEVFHDDRFDMYPLEVNDDMLVLLGGGPRTAEVLEDWDIDLVLWQRRPPLAQILSADPAWRTLHEEADRWVLFCRRGADVGGRVGVC
jgi:hypothetical protein